MELAGYDRLHVCNVYTARTQRCVNLGCESKLENGPTAFLPGTHAL